VFDNAVDLRDELARNPAGGPNWRVPLEEKTGLVVHYNGGPVPASVSDRAWIDRVVSWHLQRDWRSNPGSAGSPIRGDGVMYHLAVGREGGVYRLRDLEDVLWHCGAWPENRTHISVFVVLGGEQSATERQMASLHRLADEWVGSSPSRTRGMVIGHQEVDWTACPGTLQGDFVLPYREVIEVTTNGRWFTETECYVGGAFWDYWVNQGGLMIFGYPLTNELDDEDPETGRKMTVQYFERAVFEWHPENQPGYRVLLRRLGAEALTG
jgi:N-acetyl-anhydromuramyl-L-alanine amidase AmpD